MTLSTSGSSITINGGGTLKTGSLSGVTGATIDLINDPSVGGGV